MNLNQSITLSPDALHQEVAGETVILDLASETYFGLDEVGTRVWQLLGETTELQSVFEQLLLEYEVDSDRLESDVDALLNSLNEAGLIHVVTNQA